MRDIDHGPTPADSALDNAFAHPTPVNSRGNRGSTSSGHSYFDDTSDEDGEAPKQPSPIVERASKHLERLGLDVPSKGQISDVVRPASPAKMKFSLTGGDKTLATKVNPGR